MTEKLILAIETSIKTGSLSILNGTEIIDSWAGNEDVSRSEDLIPQIGRLLDKNDIKLNHLQKIAVSTGPGSFTGIRVGIAAAKGLAFAVDCPLVGASMFEALAFSGFSSPVERLTVIVSAGRDLYFWQNFQGLTAVKAASTGSSTLLENFARSGGR